MADVSAVGEDGDDNIVKAGGADGVGSDGEDGEDKIARVEGAGVDGVDGGEVAEVDATDKDKMVTGTSKVS